MNNNPFPFNLSELIPFVTKLVASFIGSCFTGLFTAEDIDDIVGEAVRKMWESKETFNPEKGTFYAWAWRISHNAVLDAVADKKKRRGISDDIVNAHGQIIDFPGPSYTDDELICNDLLEDFLGKLKSDRERRILLYLHDGFKPKEIAEREGMSIKAVYMAVFHIKRKLKGSA